MGALAGRGPDMRETHLQERCLGHQDAGLPASPPVSFQPGVEGGKPGSGPQRDPPCGASSGVTQVHVLVLFLKTLSLGFLDDVPALVELVNRHAHNLQYTRTHTCTQACTHSTHRHTAPGCTPLQPTRRTVAFPALEEAQWQPQGTRRAVASPASSHIPAKSRLSDLGSPPAGLIFLVHSAHLRECQAHMSLDGAAFITLPSGRHSLTTPKLPPDAPEAQDPALRPALP